MRRIYESRALERDGDDPHMPKESGERPATRGSRTINWGNASHALVPSSLRHYAISVSVETDRERYAPDQPVTLRVEFHNRAPLPIALRTDSQMRWTWAVDGLPEASRYEVDISDEPGLLEFDRGERKVFTRQWYQRFRESEREWSRAARGEYTVSAGVNVADADRKGLADETTVRIE